MHTGADEVDPDLNLVKGGGGALLREKMVEVQAKQFIVIVDESKLCDGLGPGFAVPVEITPFCWEHTMQAVGKLPSLAGCKPKLRLGSSSNNKEDGTEPAVTDNGNYIVDVFREAPLDDVDAAAAAIKATSGVVEHGLFVGRASTVVVVGRDGGFVDIVRHSSST